LTDNKYHQPSQRSTFYREVLDRIQALPGVLGAAVVTSIPYSDHSNGSDFMIDGRQVDPADRPTGMYQVASASYFETLHVPLREGRFLSESDGPETQKVVVISERMARRWWDKESPLGKRIRLGGDDSKSPWLTVVGVVGDVVHSPYDRVPRRTIYVSYQQFPALWMDVGVRTAGDALLAASSVTRAIRSVDPEQPITEIASLEKLIHNRAVGLNYMAVLMGIFGILALVLSGVGVYGVMAYLVSEQTQEIGIRMALGAERFGVLRLIVRRGMWTVLVGLIIGMPVAYACARLMASLIFGVTTNDPVTFVGVPLMLAGVAALAIYIPAQRAMRIDPIMALRCE